MGRSVRARLMFSEVLFNPTFSGERKSERVNDAQTGSLEVGEEVRDLEVWFWDELSVCLYGILEFVIAMPGLLFHKDTAQATRSTPVI